MEEKKLQILNNGKMAELSFRYFKPLLDKERENTLSKIKQANRMGEHDVVSYASSLAVLNALDDLESVITRQIQAAQNIEKEVINNANG